VRYLFIRAEKAFYPLTVLCRVLEVSRSGYYAFERRGPSSRAAVDHELTTAIREIHRKSRRTYGSPRVHRELRHQDRRVGRKRVARLMQSDGLAGRRRRRFCRTTDSDHRQPVAENVLDRRFAVTRPNQVWVSDITYFATREGWLYLAVILDLFSRRVVGFALSTRIDTALVLTALWAALRHRRLRPGLLHHSDRGSQYASGEHQAVLRAHGMVCSMSRRGNCWDNAVAESFFSTLKNDLGSEEPYPTREAGQAEIAGYIDNFYNPERRHSALDYLSPIEYELKSLAAQQAT
jgi:putative transposase